MKARRAAAAGIGCAMALGGCSTTGPPSGSAAIFAEAIPICAILANPKPHVGKRVLVRGYLTRIPHGRGFMDEGCERSLLPLNHFQDGPRETGRARRLRQRYQAYDQSRRGPPWVPAVYSGILKDHSPALIAFADSLSLEEAELVALGRPVRTKSRETD
jgi:hypothetical protein